MMPLALPIKEVDFEETFALLAPRDELVRLSKRRFEAARRLSAYLDASLSSSSAPGAGTPQRVPALLRAAATAACAYRDAWGGFAGRRLSDVGESRARATHGAVAFPWQIFLVPAATAAGGDAAAAPPVIVRHADSCVMYESACAALLAAALLQRARTLPETRRALDIVRQTRALLTRFVPRIGPRGREPHVLCPTYFEALSAALEGQALFCAARDGVLKRDPDRAPHAPVMLLQSAARFKRATQLLPTQRDLAACRARSAAFAYYFLVDDVAGARDDYEHAYGVALACIEEALALDSEHTTAPSELIARKATAMRQHNDAVVYARVPSRAALSVCIDRSGREKALRLRLQAAPALADDDDDAETVREPHITIVIPRPPPAILASEDILGTEQ
jgi:hypothetical protein